jgi:hypothetical protein
VFRILSGWVALTRAAPVHDSGATVVGLALPGDLVSAEILEAAEADAAVCLGPVSVMAASEAVLRGLAATNPAVDHWMASQGASRRSWAKFCAAEGGSGQERRRLAALLSGSSIGSRLRG